MPLVVEDEIVVIAEEYVALESTACALAGNVDVLVGGCLPGEAVHMLLPCTTHLPLLMIKVSFKIKVLSQMY